MIITVFGRVADDLGHVHQTGTVATDDGRGCRVEHRMFALPAEEYRARQAAIIAVELEHGGPRIGHVASLERDEGGIYAVAEVAADDDVLDPDARWYWSPTLRSRANATDITMEALAIVATPGTVGAKPLAFIPGPIAAAAANTTGDLGQRLARARDTRASRHPGAPIQIVDVRWRDPVEHRAATRPDPRAIPYHRPARPLEYTAPVGHVLEVR